MRTESAIAKRFAVALTSLDQRRIRITIDVYSAAFDAAEPALATSPERRARLAAAIEELVETDVLSTSAAVDRSELPPLPRFLTFRDRAEDPSAAREAAAYPWRPELAWAARLPLRRSEFDALRAIQVFIRDRASSAPVVPAAERSLELFGDEKRLDSLLRNRRLFAPGRLALPMLRARVFSSPFVFRRVGTGPVALVLENAATYHSVCSVLPEHTPVGLVAFGGGANFAASVLYFLELAQDHSIPRVSAIRYFGDLDRPGLDIPLAANEAAEENGLPSVRPAVALYAMLLRRGRRVRTTEDAELTPRSIASVERLVLWLPCSLRAQAKAVLLAGDRMAQEAVGTEVLSTEGVWGSWAGLTPPVVERAGDGAPIGSLRGDPTIVGEAALVVNDAGERVDPTASGWEQWVACSHTRNWCLDDPLLDWLKEFGAPSFVRDDKRATYDSGFDFRKFVLEKGVAFEEAVVRTLATRAPVTTIAKDSGDSRSLAMAQDTVRTMRAGAPIIAQAVLWNPERRTYGIVDLLVRSDLLATWFPELIGWDEATTGATALGLVGFHYRPIEIKFHTFDLNADGHAGASNEQLAYAVQLWLYLEALGRIQGYRPASGYLLGRTWKQGEVRGEGCLERIARVDENRWVQGHGSSLGDIARDALAWRKRLRENGSTWRVLPTPSAPELYPHARNYDDAPWRLAKREIADALAELTLLPAMNPTKRREAHAAGIIRWDQEGVSAARLGITTPTQAARVEAVLLANRTSPPTVVPARIDLDPNWRSATPIEFFVDFETVSNVDDDFTTMPAVGGQPLIVQVGCGHVNQSGIWEFAQWTVNALALDEERRILDLWLAHMVSECASIGIELPHARICHWSPAEPASLESAYNSARARHRASDWPAGLPWFDLLEEVVRKQPVGIAGAFGFGLKAVTRAMRALGAIDTEWDDGPSDGLGAMVAIWNGAREYRPTSRPLAEHPLVKSVAKYNETDCRAMCSVISWLRQHR